jgi:hypothetical protein
MMRSHTILIAICGAALLLPACAKRSKEAPQALSASARPMAKEEGEIKADKASPSKSKDRSKKIGVGTLGSIGKGGGGPPGAGYGRMAKNEKKPQADGEADDKSPEEPGVQTRAWFPETFLFQPRVVTDASGKAEVSVRVPDRLTSWRVLALAHSRSGGQAGAVTSFLGTLPVYVEPVVPPQLRVGDKVRLPINLVNTTAAAVDTELKLSAVGLALDGPASQKVTVPGRKSVVRYVTLRATQVGKARLLAQLASADKVVREIAVVPLGRPVQQRRSGTLASPRTLTISRAAGANPNLGRVHLQVFPGALAMLRSELASAGGRGRDLADEAFALLLAGRAETLLKALGAAPASKQGVGAKQVKALRDMRILATQRVLRRARVLNISSATLLAEAALAHPESPILTRLGKRAIAQIARKQAPDGTCGGATGWSLQRLLVATADCARAAKSKRTVVVRASGAFERNAARIKDAYTAAAVLASGAVSDALRKKLRKLITLSIKTRKDGSKELSFPSHVRRADGRRPSAVEAAALAAMALIDVPNAPVADLGARILAGYSPSYGWGDGRANLVCMQAALKLFRNPLPDKVTITLARDGKQIALQKLDKKRLREVVTLAAAAGGADGARQQRWTITADPAVPGLGFSLLLTDRVPWTKTKLGGIELSVTLPKEAKVGKTAALQLQATAPGGRYPKITLALPAGVQLDKKYLDTLVGRGALRRYKADDEQVEIWAPRTKPAKMLSLEIRVIPTLAGTISAGATIYAVGGRAIHDPPRPWTITP